MSSAGAQCNHIAHVSTQLPYALTAAGISFLTYLVAGFAMNAAVPLFVGIGMMIGIIFFLRWILKTPSTADASQKETQTPETE